MNLIHVSRINCFEFACTKKKRKRKNLKACFVSILVRHRVPAELLRVAPLCSWIVVLLLRPHLGLGFDRNQPLWLHSSGGGSHGTNRDRHFWG